MKIKLNKSNCVILIYARLNSKRLPNKAIIKINSKNIISIIIDRIKKKSKYNLPIIICSSKNKSDDKLINFCKKKKIKFFRGSLNNVFERTIECSVKHNFSSFVRVCADRPFFDVKLMDKMIKKFNENKYDIITNQFIRTYPKGLGCEIASTKIFKEVNLFKLNKLDKEHIFNFFYKNYKNYKIFNYRLRKNKKNVNWSLDNKKDLIRIKKIYNKFSENEYIDILRKN